ncbi:unnamed protein product [Blepharisma stoltei]|uniref:Methyltransferase type 11 domain-containing protein n=1 Tax=Blepharisma stoltei TaxID=1481888 RepID=A0AAU9JF42_9CILI|nr:unnamed protein product [Blepharisma stoltei]
MDEEDKQKEEIKQHYNEIADWYEEYADLLTASVYHSFLPTLHLESSSKIIEVACGTGLGLSLLMSHILPEAEIYASDLSPAMLAKAQKRNLPKLNLIEAANDALPYEDNFFDRYIANFSLQLVPDASSMLRESYRVLAENGISVFSVWGRREICNCLNIIDEAVFEVLGEEDNKKRSPFYLNDQELLKKLIKEAGYRKVYTYYTSTPYGPTGSEETMKFYEVNPNLWEYKKKSEEIYLNILSKIREKVALLVEKEEIIMFDALIIIAYK